MSSEAERIEMYEIVPTEGTAEDVCRYVNREELLRLWPRLVAAAACTTGLGASAWCCGLVSLDLLHEHIARIALALPEAGQGALAGGGAMLADDLVDRPTQDVDLFTPDPSEVTRLADALLVVLRAEGAQVRVDRREPGFTRLAVTVADEDPWWWRSPTTHASAKRCRLWFSAGPHPDEVAADKTLALFGRAAARDLVDVATLSERYTLERLCELAPRTQRQWSCPSLRRSQEGPRSGTVCQR